MPTEFVLILLAAVVGSSSLVGIGMWFYYRVKRIEGENEGLRQLSAQLDTVCDRLEQQQTQLAELLERLDFAERVLASERDAPGRLPRGEA